MSGKPRDRTALQLIPQLEPGRAWGNRAARELWRTIVSEWPAGHFLESDRADMEVFTLATVEAREHETALSKEGSVLKRPDGTAYPNPRALLRDRAAVRMRDSGRSLRLHLSSRMRSEAAHAATNQPGAGHVRPWENNIDAYFDDPTTTANYLPRETAQRRRVRKSGARD